LALISKHIGYSKNYIWWGYKEISFALTMATIIVAEDASVHEDAQALRKACQG
jgi:hypothetical protein